MRFAELKRHIITNFTPAKMILLPLTLLGIFLLIPLMGDGDFWEPAKVTSGFLCVFILAIGGTIFIMQSISTEVTGQTWPLQKMTAITALDMTISKLFGPTAFLWYLSIIPGLIYITSGFVLSEYVDLQPQRHYGAYIELTPGEMRTAHIMHIVSFLMLTLSLHALTLAAKVLSITESEVTKKKATANGINISWVIIIIVGFNLVVAAIQSIQYGDMEFFKWYMLDITMLDAILLSATFTVIWTMVAAYRTMQAELQYRITSVYWLTFLLTFPLFVAGFHHELTMLPYFERLIASLFVTHAVGLIFAFLVDSLDPVYVRRVRDSITNKAGTLEVAKLLSPIPVSIVLLAVTAILFQVLLLLPTEPLKTIQDWFMTWDLHRGGSLSFFPIIVLLLLIRDTVMFTLITNSDVKKPGVTFILYFSVIYGLIPALLSTGEAHHLFIPVRGGTTIAELVSPLAQALMMVGLLILSKNSVLEIDDK